MEATADLEFDFLADLPQREDEWPEELRNEISAYTTEFQAHDGLILQAVVPDLLQVSKQRFHQLKKEYDFQSWDFFGKTWYSRRQLEEFHKVNRKQGQPGHDVSKILKTLIKEG